MNRDTESVVALTPNIGLIGGADRDRTGGLLVANQALSQLSYSPFFQCAVPSTQYPANSDCQLGTEYRVLITDPGGPG